MIPRPMAQLNVELVGVGTGLDEVGCLPVSRTNPDRCNPVRHGRPRLSGRRHHLEATEGALQQPVFAPWAGERRPTLTCIGVAQLAYPEIHLEVQGSALVPS